MTQGETNVEHRHSSDELMLGIAKVFTLARLAGWYVHLSSAQSDWIELELRKREDTREDSWVHIDPRTGSLLRGYSSTDPT